MLPHFLLPLLTLLVSTVSAAPTDQTNLTRRDGSVNLGFPYGDQKVRGVNLGGWLVLEPFITPSLFENLDESIIDEYTFGQNQDYNTAVSALKNHWDTWITKADFERIAASGLNHVRLPIGYWAFQTSPPYITGQKAYLYSAIQWARETGLKVLIDLHGAEGSQNGFDNSGQRGSARWAEDAGRVQRTREIVEQISREFSDPQYFGVVTAIAILNEPAFYLNDNLLQVGKQFTIDAYYNARYPWASQGSGSSSGLLVVYHDGFQPSTFWNGVFNYPSAADLALDTHIYQVFSTPEVSRTWGEHLTSACDSGANLRNAPNWPVVGEWSLAVYDCARWLNGRGIGARYDGSYPGSGYVGTCGDGNTGDGSGFSDEYKTFLRDFYDTQVQTWESNGQGYFFWTWKTENAAEWSYSHGLDGGWIPQDPTQHNAYKCS